MHLCLKFFKKMPVKEFNFSVKVSSVGPASILKYELFHPLFLKLFEHDCRRTILDNTFWWLFSERFVPEKFDLKIQVKS